MDVTLEAIAAELAKQLEGVESRLAAHVSGDVAKRLEGTESRLAAHVSDEVSKRLDRAESRLAAHVSDEVSKRLTETEGRLEARLTKGFDEIKHQAALHREALKQDVIAAAEGYGANLERIERELVELNKKVDTRFGDHEHRAETRAMTI